MRPEVCVSETFRVFSRRGAPRPEKFCAQENGLTNLTGAERAQYVQGMFSRIARRYDLMNRVMTTGAGCALATAGDPARSHPGARAAA